MASAFGRFARGFRGAERGRFVSVGVGPEVWGSDPLRPFRFLSFIIIIFVLIILIIISLIIISIIIISIDVSSLYLPAAILMLLLFLYVLLLLFLVYYYYHYFDFSVPLGFQSCCLREATSCHFWKSGASERCSHFSASGRPRKGGRPHKKQLDGP